MAKTKKTDCATVGAKHTTIRVGVGYGWMKVEDGDTQNERAVLSDVFWQTLRTVFEPKHTAIEKIGNRVDFSRLRASHGKIIWDSVLERIRKSDILIFDVTDFDLCTIVREMGRKGMSSMPMY